jgi:hypothetical protein
VKVSELQQSLVSKVYTSYMSEGRGCMQTTVEKTAYIREK